MRCDADMNELSGLQFAGASLAKSLIIIHCLTHGLNNEEHSSDQTGDSVETQLQVLTTNRRQTL